MSADGRTSDMHSPEALPSTPAKGARRSLQLDDERLLAECEIHAHRTGGPGGQHRNKVSSAIRLVHRPTGLIATAGERRSQHENKSQAVGRLRELLAVHVREPLAERVVWPESVQIRDEKLRVGATNPGLWPAIGLALDALAANAGRLRESAEYLGVTASSLTRFLADHPKAWAEANRIRAAAGLGPLKS